MSEALRSHNEARTLLQDGRVEQAYLILREAIQRFPENTMLLSALRDTILRLAQARPDGARSAQLLAELANSRLEDYMPTAADLVYLSELGNLGLPLDASSASSVIETGETKSDAGDTLAAREETRADASSSSPALKEQPTSGATDASAISTATPGVMQGQDQLEFDLGVLATEAQLELWESTPDGTTADIADDSADDLAELLIDQDEEEPDPLATKAKADATSDSGDIDSTASDGFDTTELLQWVDSDTLLRSGGWEHADVDPFSIDITLLGEEPERPEDAFRLPAAVTREERAQQTAAEFLIECGWNPRDLSVLVRFFLTYGWGAARSELRRLVQLEVTPEELRLAMHIRSYWTQRSYLWRTTVVGGDIVKSSLPWTMSLLCVRACGAPYDEDELEVWMEDAFEEWRFSAQGSVSSCAFIDYLAEKALHAVGPYQPVVPNSSMGDTHDDQDVSDDPYERSSRESLKRATLSSVGVRYVLNPGDFQQRLLELRVRLHNLRQPSRIRR